MESKEPSREIMLKNLYSAFQTVEKQCKMWALKINSTVVDYKKSKDHVDNIDDKQKQTQVEEKLLPNFQKSINVLLKEKKYGDNLIQNFVTVKKDISNLDMMEQEKKDFDKLSAPAVYFFFLARFLLHEITQPFCLR